MRANAIEDAANRLNNICGEITKSTEEKISQVRDIEQEITALKKNILDLSDSNNELSERIKFSDQEKTRQIKKLERNLKQKTSELTRAREETSFARLESMRQAKSYQLIFQEQAEDLDMAWKSVKRANTISYSILMTITLIAVGGILYVRFTKH